MTTTAERIREIRLSLGLSQKNLAEMLNLTQGTISNCENGIRCLSIKSCYKLIKIARIGGKEISIEYLRPE